MIYTIKGEIVKQQTQEDFVHVGWALAYDGKTYLSKVWRLNNKKTADRYVSKKTKTFADVCDKFLAVRGTSNESGRKENR